MAESDWSAAILLLLEEFQRSGARELHVRSGEFELFISNDASSIAPHVAGRSSSPKLAVVPEKPQSSSPILEPASKPAAGLPENATIVTAPYLGTFYRSPKPGAAPYVEIGTNVVVGDELCLIEVMKLFTAVKSATAGRLHAILVDDGAMVESGEPLFAIVPN